jgi:hypothetical protein
MRSGPPPSSRSTCGVAVLQLEGDPERPAVVQPTKVHDPVDAFGSVPDSQRGQIPEGHGRVGIGGGEMLAGDPYDVLGRVTDCGGPSVGVGLWHEGQTHHHCDDRREARTRNRGRGHPQIEALVDLPASLISSTPPYERTLMAAVRYDSASGPPGPSSFY